MREFEIFIPLNYNDGSPVEWSKLKALQALLLEHFGGFTYFPQPSQGFWKMGEVTYQDEIVIYRVVSRKARAARRFIAKLKAELKKSLNQEEIFIIERRVKVH